MTIISPISPPEQPPTLDPSSPLDGSTETQRVLRLLTEKGLRPVDIARRTGDVFSERTIYRWTKGECEPKQLEHIRILRRLLQKVTEDPDFLLTPHIIS